MQASASSNHILEINANEYEVDEEGFLRNISDWSREVAEGMAAQDGIELEQAHWEVITFLRDYYFRYQIAPAIRVLNREKSFIPAKVASFPRKRRSDVSESRKDGALQGPRLRGDDWGYVRG